MLMITSGETELKKSHLPLRRVRYREHQRMEHGSARTIVLWEKVWLHLDCGHKVRTSPSQAQRQRVRCDQCGGRVYSDRS